MSDENIMDREARGTASTSENARPGRLLIVISVVLTILAGFLALTLSLYRSHDAAYLAGAVTAPSLMAIIIVGLFQIGKRFRNARSRLKIYSWVLGIVVLGTFNQLIRIAVSGAGA